MSHGILKTAFISQDLELEYPPRVEGTEGPDDDRIPPIAALSSHPEVAFAEEFAHLLSTI